jgi:hypothetical protein
VRQALGVQEAFGIVVFVVAIGGAIVAIITFVTSAKAYDQIGRGGMSLNDGTDRPADETLSGAAGERVRVEEIRQMLEGRNARRRRRGEPELDIEEQLAELLQPAFDPGLEQEVRDLVEARNRRRIRSGKEPLDVEEEVARQLRELG